MSYPSQGLVVELMLLYATVINHNSWLFTLDHYEYLTRVNKEQSQLWQWIAQTYKLFNATKYSSVTTVKT